MRRVATPRCRPPLLCISSPTATTCRCMVCPSIRPALFLSSSCPIAVPEVDYNACSTGVLLMRSPWIDDDLAILQDSVAKVLQKEFAPHRERWDDDGIV